MRTSFKYLNTGHPYFITSTIVNWVPIFTSEKYYNIFMDNLKFYQDKFNMQIVSFVLMQDHFHLICYCDKLPEAIKSFKSYTAKKIIKELEHDSKYDVLKLLEINKKPHKIDSKYQVWQEGYYPKQIFNEKVLEQKINYIHYNPVRKRLVENPEDWKYSSASIYLKNKDCGIEISL